MAEAFNEMFAFDDEEYLDEDELESVKMALTYILMKDTGMDADKIYELVFQNGTKITWH
jgi:hypothetical protein